jgi:hypothetical protein
MKEALSKIIIKIIEKIRMIIDEEIDSMESFYKQYA